MTTVAAAMILITAVRAYNDEGALFEKANVACEDPQFVTLSLNDISKIPDHEVQDEYELFYDYCQMKKKFSRTVESNESLSLGSEDIFKSLLKFVAGDYFVANEYCNRLEPPPVCEGDETSHLIVKSNSLLPSSNCQHDHTTQKIINTTLYKINFLYQQRKQQHFDQGIQYLTAGDKKFLLHFCKQKIRCHNDDFHCLRFNRLQFFERIFEDSLFMKVTRYCDETQLLPFASNTKKAMRQICSIENNQSSIIYRNYQEKHLKLEEDDDEDNYDENEDNYQEYCIERKICHPCDMVCIKHNTDLYNELLNFQDELAPLGPMDSAYLVRRAVKTGDSNLVKERIRLWGLLLGSAFLASMVHLAHKYGHNDIATYIVTYLENFD